MTHLVFYDGECGICDQFVQFLLKHDRKKSFVFAPLQGLTAQVTLEALPAKYKNLDTLILIEDYKTSPKMFIQAKAVFKIFWQLGHLWALLGLLSFLPSYFFDWGYRLFARNRHRLTNKIECVVPTKSQRERFLP
ncbi:MAG: DUF393 domain-containing protein [Parachlamydia sp.]|jgi:predicted DCC family thiol-disulfide oxidoreductase YuxK|nr:DUF393 domain-containing protein [Parachlamydia sp.]